LLLLLLLQFHLNALAPTHTDRLELLSIIFQAWAGCGGTTKVGEMAASPRLGRRDLLQEALREQRQRQL
jgi:hypothetical protein